MIVPLSENDAQKLDQYSSIVSLDDIVKELIENSIDAHASSVDVYLRLADTLSIRCQDNGEGIAKEDMEKVGLPFHTSKSGDSTTMGFRGSALGSMFSLCSECKIVSKRRDAFSLKCRNGERALERYEEEFPRGTLVSLSNIFAQLPIRRKYTASVPRNSIILAIKMTVFHIMANFPKVRIRAFDLSDNRKLFDCTDALSLLNIRLIDRKKFQQCTEHLSVEGFIGTAQHRGIRFIYINSRRFLNKRVYRRLDQRFGRKASCSYVFYISCDISAIELAQDPSKVAYHTEYDQEIESVCGRLIDEYVHRGSSKRVLFLPKRRKVMPSISPFFPSAVTAKFKASSFSDCFIISQLDNKYILAKVGGSYKQRKTSSLVILDQHACDERIKVEALQREFVETCQQNALSAGEIICIAVSREDGILLRDFQGEFVQWGILYQVDSQLKVFALPSILSQRRDMIKDCLLTHCFEMKENMHSIKAPLFRVGNIPCGIMDLIISKACRTAVKFGDALSIGECAHILRELSKCKQPFNCAHGRPLMVPLADLGGAKEDIDYE